MPHIIIEYSENAFNITEVNTLLNGLAMAIANTKLFKPQNPKIRLHPAQHFLLDKSFNGFIHVQCRIHQGRSENEKKQVSHSILSALTPYSNSAIVITVEIIEMERHSYAKTIVN